MEQSTVFKEKRLQIKVERAQICPRFYLNVWFRFVIELDKIQDDISSWCFNKTVRTCSCSNLNVFVFYFKCFFCIKICCIQFARRLFSHGYCNFDQLLQRPAPENNLIFTKLLFINIKYCALFDRNLMHSI